MLLVIDAGNTQITFGLYEGDVLVRSFAVLTDVKLSVRELEESLSSNISGKIDGAIIGSVVDELNERLKYAVLDLYKVMPVVLTPDMDTGISIGLKDNSEIGADRIANAYRAYELYKKAVIVVDFGTAVTFDIVNSKGCFIGGIIAPGLNTQLKSLNVSTSKLPKLEVEDVDNVIGKNTKEAILSGVIAGCASMVEGMLIKCEKELGEKAVIISTGGHCEIVSKYMTRKFDAVIPNLTLEGLRDLYKRLQ